MQLALIRNPAVLLGAALGISLAFLQPLAASAEPGVARISAVQGSVAVQRADTNQPVAAGVNAPVLGADSVTTGDNSRAEVDLDGASSVRLGSGVQMRFADLDPGNRRLQLAQGSVDLRAFNGNDLGTEIDTPSISVRPHDPGSTRVNVTPDGRTWVTVRSGSADIITPQGTRTVGPGGTLVASGNASNPSIATQGAIASDSFDTWNGQRDQYYQAGAPSDAYVDPSIIGVDDLQPYGHWVDDTAYGQVWVPTAQPAGWSPYENGRWVWEDGYGWTWVGNEPWGWAPYHYGAWYRGSHGWAWYPPAPGIVAPVWQPALVAFIGFGGGSGLSIALNLGDPGYDVGWVPLAPFEPYYPWYGNGGPLFVNQFTVINNPGIYRNYRYGVVGVSGRDFVSGQFGHPQRFAAAQLRNARGFRGAVPIAPTAANLRFTNGRVASQLAVRPNVARMRFAGNAPVARRTSFAQSRATMASRLGHARVNTVAARFSTPTTPAAIHAAAQRITASRTTAARTASRPNTVHTAVRPNNVRTAARPNVAHTATRPNVARTATRPNVAHGSTTNPAWQRFGNQRGVHVGAHNVTPRTNAHVTTARVQAARPNARVSSGRTTPSHVTAARTAPTTVRARLAPVTHAAPVARSYAAPTHVRSAPAARTYSAPVARTYSAPARTYSAPVRTAPVAHQPPPQPPRQGGSREQRPPR